MNILVYISIRHTEKIRFHKVKKALTCDLCDSFLLFHNFLKNTKKFAAYEVSMV